MNRRIVNGTIIAAFYALFATAAQAKTYTVTVTAPDHDYRDAPVSILVDEPPGPLTARLLLNHEAVPAQIRRVGDKAEVTWIVPELKKGGQLHYTLHVAPRASTETPDSSHGVTIAQDGKNLDIRIEGKPFTRYDTTTGPNKPYFYPLFGPDSKRMVRGYPIDKIPGEVSKDHPHHRGMWFSHGAVNGEDYWSETAKAAKTVHVRYEDIQSGPVYGSFRAITDWIDHEGKKAAEDVREVRVYNIADGRLMDFALTFKPAGVPVTFEDTKEGTFGLRLPDSMRVAVEHNQPGQGRIETSAGVKDAAAWGKRADWVDYYGPVDGETLGVAILDDPKNLRHPTTWHVRDYGLFAANPFGLHDFDSSQPQRGGNVTIPANGSLAFRYRIFLHKGTTADAHIADLWSAYADPPRVQVQESR